MNYRQKTLDADFVSKLTQPEICSFTYKVSRKHLKKKRRAIDVGSKFGHFTANLLQDFKQVDAFDMRNKMRWKMLDRTMVTFHEIALGETSGQIEFWGASTGVPVLGKQKDIAQVRTLDSFRFTDVDYIKIDVEGDELSVLKGAVQTLGLCRPLVVVEQNKVVEKTKKGTEFQALEWLLDNKYRIVDHDGMDDWILAHV